ncbi:galactose/methyl galactoside import ATP-binding protein MglA [Synergistales bacterium]|nr:galactose/methyl galactoside import ATP-binding protein MglA [Synergistales bacterium]
MAANTEYVLEMRGMTKRFPGVHALKNAQLLVRPGTVHALMGENGAGKSTLMKCLFGIYNRDGGEVLLDGKPVVFENPHQALAHGVSMVHQELNQVLELSVMENVWLGRLFSKGFVVDKKRLYNETKTLFERLKIDVDPRTKIGTLSVSQRQMVEIAKAVSCNAKVLVLDEPTSSLADKEVKHLFEIVRNLTQQGSAIIYISHKMGEILQISHDVTIMRDGEWIATHPASQLTTDKIIKLMVGREIVNRFPPKLNKPTDKIVLKVRGLTGYYQPTVTDMSFDLYEGEILGIAGLMGARRTEAVETIFGIRRLARGTIEKNGKKITSPTPRSSIANGFSLVTEERRRSGIFEDLNIAFNTAIVKLPAYCKMNIVDDKAIKQDTAKIIKMLRIRTPSQKTHIRALSGGNQQKVIVGRWLLADPDIFLLDEPTRGIDVGAKYEIYQIMGDVAKEGKSVIFISSEMPELLGVSDRILVMSNGRVAGIVAAKSTNQEEIMALSAKYL